MAKLSRNAIIGYPAGIITGITYGLNPLFAKPLMNDGASTETILLFRYGIAVILLGAYLLLKKESFKITLKQAGVLLALGLFYTASSTFLFEAYKYIASGLATTLVFLFPVMVAIIMVFLKVVPSWPVWLSIGATKASVLGVFEPITAILVGTLVFGEALTTNIIAGILISIIAVTFMIMVTKR